MEKLGLFEGREDREIELAHSDRSKTPIEPYLSDQWFVQDGRPGADGDGRRHRRPGAVFPGALRQDLPRLARREARLVHQPAALVGTSHSDLVRALSRGGAEEGLRRTASDVVWRRDEENDRWLDLRSRGSAGRRCWGRSTRWSRTPTCSTPGSARPSGRTRRSAGPASTAGSAAGPQNPEWRR